MRPARTCGSIVGRGSKMRWRPDRRSGNAGPVPWDGTWVISMPAMRLNNSPEKCEVLPGPADAKLSCPGRALAYAISSFIIGNR